MLPDALVTMLAALAFVVACPLAILVVLNWTHPTRTPVACPVPMPFDDGITVAMRVGSVLAHLETAAASERALSAAVGHRAAVLAHHLSRSHATRTPRIIVMRSVL